LALPAIGRTSIKALHTLLTGPEALVPTVTDVSHLKRGCPNFLGEYYKRMIEGSDTGLFV
jgi:hypothetical protein